MTKPQNPQTVKTLAYDKVTALYSKSLDEWIAKINNGLVNVEARNIEGKPAKCELVLPPDHKLQTEIMSLFRDAGWKITPVSDCVFDFTPNTDVASVQATEHQTFNVIVLYPGDEPLPRWITHQAIEDLELNDEDEYSDWCGTLVIRDGEEFRSYTDKGEPEDQTFRRDWSWIVGELRNAYERGVIDGANRCRS